MKISPTIKKQLKQCYAEQVRKAGGVIYVTVACEFSDRDMAEVRRILGVDELDKEQVHFRVDPSLLAGLIIQKGSDVVDLSVKGKLRRVKQTLYMYG